VRSLVDHHGGGSGRGGSNSKHTGLNTGSTSEATTGTKDAGATTHGAAGLVNKGLPGLTRVLFTEPFRSVRVRATGKMQPFDCGLVFKKSKCNLEDEPPPFTPYNRTAARLAAHDAHRERVFMKNTGPSN
jgi:hypothetical protein